MKKLNADKFDSDDFCERIDEIFLKDKIINYKLCELRREIDILKASSEKKNIVENE